MSAKHTGEFNCECVARMNVTLVTIGCHVDMGTMIEPSTGQAWQFMRVMVRQLQASDRKRRLKPPNIIVKFCPFCGMSTGPITVPRRKWPPPKLTAPLDLTAVGK